MLGICESLFNCIESQFSENTKTNLKNVATIAAVGIACIAVYKTITYLASLELNDCDLETRQGTKDPYFPRREYIAKYFYTERQKYEAPKELIIPTPKKRVEIPVKKEVIAPKNNDFFTRFEKLEAYAGLNPWDVPATDY